MDNEEEGADGGEGEGREEQFEVHWTEEEDYVLVRRLSGLTTGWVYYRRYSYYDTQYALHVERYFSHV